MKYKVKHKDGVDIVEADSYYVEGLSTARVSVFEKVGWPPKAFFLTESIDRIDDGEEGSLGESSN